MSCRQDIGDNKNNDEDGNPAAAADDDVRCDIDGRVAGDDDGVDDDTL